MEKLDRYLNVGNALVLKWLEHLLQEQETMFQSWSAHTKDFEMVVVVSLLGCSGLGG